MLLSNLLSLFFGELEPSVVVTLGFAHILIVSLIVLYKEKLTKTANAEPQIILTPPSTDPSIELNTVEEEHNSSSSDIETEPVTAYCNNGCQGACACPALESHLDIQRKSNPTLTPLSVEDQSPSGAPDSEPLFQTEDQSMRSLRKKCTDEKLTMQYCKEKFHRESIDAGNVQTRSEFDVGERRKSESRNSFKSKSDSWNIRSSRKKSTDENKSFSNIVNRLHPKSHDAVIERAESELTGSERRGSKVKESHKKRREESRAGDKPHRKSFDTGSVQSGIENDGSESTGSGGSENHKTERKMSRFQKWRRRLSGAKKEEDKNKDASEANTEVTQRSSKHDTDSSKILHGNISSENATNIDEATGTEKENMTA